MEKTSGNDSKIFRFLIYIVVLALLYWSVYSLFPKYSADIPYLSQYSVFVMDALYVIIAGVGGILLSRMILSLIDGWIAKQGVAKRELRFVHTLVSIFLYGIVVSIVLVTLHVNLTGLLVGGAVGGIVIGLAVQTVASNLFAGLLVSGSNTVNVGDVIQFHSGTIGGNLVGTVKRVTILFTYVEDINGLLVKLPNSSFVGSTTFTNLEEDGLIIYQYNISLNDDVQSSLLLPEVEKKLDSGSKDLGNMSAEMYLYGKSGSTNIYSIILKFSNPKEFNLVVHKVNQAIEESYRELKNKAGS